eukprot:TRINITY_DN8995_c0_g1_i2.p1 TRINITY_DN8995_c0_g1~~TRINITY_DN8995_c0_g1_i2.p1  ORF type:complete len:303 (+),score=65.37 TRINITY_DN8995_c0_g1_i2:2-910(+)
MAEAEASSSTISNDAKRKIAQNKAKALERKAVRAAEKAFNEASGIGKSAVLERQGFGQSPALGALQGTTAKASGRHKAKSTGFFKDTQAGFLLDDEDANKGNDAKKAKTIIQHEPGAETMPSFPLAPRCQDCEQEFTHSFLNKNFDLAVCNTCKDLFRDGKYRLVTKTTATKEYLLRDSDLTGKPGSLRFIERTNPNNDSYNKMKLFLFAQVQARSFERYGDEDGLEAEHNRRVATQQGHKDRRRKERIDKLRKETLTTSWMKQRKKHEHVFRPEDEVYNEEEDEWTKTCAECGFQVTYEKL